MRRLPLLMLALCCTAAQAERLTEPGTGLSVDPPAGYSATIAAPRPPNTAVISIRRPNDSDTGCQVAYRPAPENAPYSQEQLNAAVLLPAWRDNATRTLGALYTIEHTEPFRHAGIEGFLVEGMVRMREGIPARAQDIRTLFIILETPRGRTSTVCVGELREFPARRAEFIAIARSTRPGQASAKP